MTAVGSSREDANLRTASVLRELTLTTRWTAATAFATGPQPTLADAAAELRERGATRLVIAPWFLAHGRITELERSLAAAEERGRAADAGLHRETERRERLDRRCRCS